MSKPIKFGPLEFVRIKYDGLDGKTKVAFQELASEFMVICDQEGIRFKGEMKEPIGTMSELQGLAELTSTAWKEHQALCPKLATTFSGH